MLRWAAEAALSDHAGTARLGQGMLDALYSSPDLLQETDKPLVDAALLAVVAEVAEEAEEPGVIVEVVETRGGVMAKTVRVTSSQVNAAKLLVKHAKVTGRSIAPGIKAVAEAKPAESFVPAGRASVSSSTTLRSPRAAGKTVRVTRAGAANTFAASGSYIINSGRTGRRVNRSAPVEGKSALAP